jgi:hypothetical protein
LATHEPLEQVSPVVAVLVEHGDPRLRPVLDDVAAVDRALADEARQVAHRPRVAPVAAPDRARAGAAEDLGHLHRVEVATDGEVVLGADRVEDREDLVLLDELPGLVDRARGVVAVIAVEVADLAAVDTAVRIDVLEVRVRAGADGPERGRGTAERDGASDQDLVRGHARGAAGDATRRERDGRRREQRGRERP